MEEMTSKQQYTENDTPCNQHMDANFAFAQGMACYEKQDFSGALNWLRAASEQGHAEANFNLGIMYKNGRGVKQNDAEALMCYLTAAEQGYSIAQTVLGIKYLYGEDVNKNETEAAK